MKPTGARWHVHNQHQLTAFTEWVIKQWGDNKKPTLQLMNADRSNNQNAFINTLYGDISRQSKDNSVLDVRRQCKLVYGVGILKAADPEFAELYDRTVKKMSFEDKLLVVGYMDITSKFNKSQATEYIDTILSEYGKQGIALAREQ
tara:strand:+ start:810 stop:1247 length:438 start_codon:yes stop_codon:yes gene_type:complete